MTNKEALKLLHNFYIIAARKNDKHILVQAIQKAVEALEKQDKIVHCNECELRKTKYCAMEYSCECGREYTWETDNDYCRWGIKAGEQE